MSSSWSGRLRVNQKARGRAVGWRRSAEDVGIASDLRGAPDLVIPAKRRITFSTCDPVKCLGFFCGVLARHQVRHVENPTTKGEGMKLWAREPAAIIAFIEALIALAVGFGLNLSGEQVAVIMAFIAAALGVLTRSQVTPSNVRRFDPR